MSDPAELIWSNLTIRTNRSGEIVSNCSSQIAPGTITAIMGPCGSGKTTLINVLAGHNSDDYIVKGSVYINGRDRSRKSWAQISAFVTHRLEAYEYQTVLEALEFASCAKIKFVSVRRQRIKEVVKQLKIWNILHRSVCHLSTGERMLLNIGMVLLGDPSLIFFDEPTSGLDSHNSMKILSTLKSLAARGKTIVTVIHQPTSSMLQYFDFVVLMGRGMQICNGSVASCVKFFSNCGYELPPNTNPADFFLDVISSTEEGTDIDEKLRSIREEWAFSAESVFPILSNPIVVEDTYVSAVPFSVLTKRNILNSVRNRASMVALFLKKFIVCLAYSLVFYNVGSPDPSRNSTVSFPGLMSCVIANILFGLSSTIIGHYSSEKKIIDYERKSGYYRASFAYFSKVLSDVFISLVFEIPTLLVMYFFVGLSDSLVSVAVFFASVVLLTVFTTSYAYFIAIALPNAQTSISVMVTCNILMMAFSGILASYNTLVPFARYVSVFSPVSYVFSLIHYTQKSISGAESGGGAGNSLWDGRSLYVIVSANFLILCLFILFFGISGVYFLNRRTNTVISLNKKGYFGV